MITCKKCGATNTDESKFCASCGADLSEEASTYVCSKCGGEVVGKKAFCNNCGAKLTYSEDDQDALAIPEYSAKKFKASSGKANFDLIKKIIFIALGGTALILSILAFFLPFGCSKSSTMPDGYIYSFEGANYWYKDIWETYKMLSEVGTDNILTLVATILMVVVYFSCLVGTLVFGTFFVINTIKVLKGKKASILRPFGFFAGFAFLYAIFVWSCFNAKMSRGLSYYTDYSETFPGVGLVFAFIAFFLFVGAIIAKFVINYIKGDKSSIGLGVVNGLTLIFAGVFGIASLGGTISASLGSYSVTTGNFYISAFLSSEAPTNAKVFGVLAFVFGILTVSSLILGIGSAVLSKKNTTFVAFPVSSLLFYIVQVVFEYCAMSVVGKEVLGITSFTDDRVLVQLAPSAIVGFIFAGLVIAGSIVGMMLKPKAKAPVIEQ